MDTFPLPCKDECDGQAEMDEAITYIMQDAERLQNVVLAIVNDVSANLTFNEQVFAKIEKCYKRVLGNQLKKDETTLQDIGSAIALNVYGNLEQQTSLLNSILAFTSLNITPTTDAFAQGPPTGGATAAPFNPEMFGDTADDEENEELLFGRTDETDISTERETVATQQCQNTANSGQPVTVGPVSITLCRGTDGQPQINLNLTINVHPAPVRIITQQGQIVQELPQNLLQGLSSERGSMEGFSLGLGRKDGSDISLAPLEPLSDDDASELDVTDQEVI